MDLLNDKVGYLYRKFLLSSFGSAFITSVYGLVDMIMIGQYHGPDGSSAMAVISPVWNIVYSFGLLTGIGGSVLYAVARGADGNKKRADGYFTASVIYGGVISAVLWLLLFLLEAPLLRLFGADDLLLPLCRRYLRAPLLTVPVYVFTGILSAFLRNDSDPGLATASVIIGGVFNVFGDYFFVFTLDMGIEGAGIATALGASISVLIMLLHFVRKKNTLHFTLPAAPLRAAAEISASGFSSFIVDVAMGVMTMLFNLQVMKHLGSDALAIYGVIVTVSTFVQCCAYGVGQTAQPIISQNYGAGLHERTRTALRYSIITCAVLGVLWTALPEAFPNVIIRLFMTPTESVLAAAPRIVRIYSISFLLLPFNVYSTYYFQATMKTRTSMAVSIARGIVISGALILALPAVAGGDAVWFAMPITEALVAAYAALRMIRPARAAH